MLYSRFGLNFFTKRRQAAKETKRKRYDDDRGRIIFFERKNCLEDSGSLYSGFALLCVELFSPKIRRDIGYCFAGSDLDKNDRR